MKKERWIEEVLDSTKGIKRARPKADLFAKIEQRIRKVEAKIIPLRRLQIAAAAAVVLMVLNVVTLSQYVDSTKNEASELTEIEKSNQPLISNFNLYE